MRYPKVLVAPVPDLSRIAEETVEYLISEFTPLINPR
jgi:hypothetical protein